MRSLSGSARGDAAGSPPRRRSLRAPLACRHGWAATYPLPPCHCLPFAGAVSLRLTHSTHNQPRRFWVAGGAHANCATGTFGGAPYGATKR
eukprot:8439044-Pyramimonas_sp.AAC.1